MLAFITTQELIEELCQRETISFIGVGMDRVRQPPEWADCVGSVHLDRLAAIEMLETALAFLRDNE
jgi:hypothetical protein